jgi:prohibitin 2
VLIAQQEAERARFIVEKALQEKKSTIIRAQGVSKSAELVGEAIKKNPAFVQLRRLDAAKEIATVISRSNNKVYLNSDSLLLNLLHDTNKSYVEFFSFFFCITRSNILLIDFKSKV